MTRSPKIVSAIALFLAFTGPGFAKVSGQTQTQSTTADRQYRDAWDAPPQGLPEAQLMGFRDGVAGRRTPIATAFASAMSGQRRTSSAALSSQLLCWKRKCPNQPAVGLLTLLQVRVTMQRQIRQAKSNSVDFRTALLARGQIWRTIAGRT